MPLLTLSHGLSGQLLLLLGLEKELVDLVVEVLGNVVGTLDALHLRGLKKR